MAADQTGVPSAVCVTCGREARCIRLSSGMIVKPRVWLYPDESKPLAGVCGDCQDLALALELAATLQAGPESCSQCGAEVLGYHRCVTEADA